MLAGTQSFPPVASFRRYTLCLVGLSAAWAAWLAPSGSSSAQAQAAQQGQSEGLYVPVSNPITDGVSAGIKRKIEDELRRGRRLKTVILDFNPNNGPAGTPEFSPCFGLAEYLLSLKSKTRTVAFVHDEVTLHTVLPVLACPVLIMSEKAAIGDVLGKQKEPLSERIAKIYQEYAGLRSSSPDLVRKMLDKKIAIYKSADGKTFLDRTRIKPGQADRFVEVPGLGAGTALIKAEDALSCGLAARILNTLQDVARAEDVSEATLRQGIAPGPKNAWLVELSGDISRAKASSALRKIKKAIGKGGNFFILVLDCQGGDSIAARDLAEDLRKLKDEERVETVAFIPPGKKLEAPTAVALGCTEILMSKDAVLGDFESLKGSDPKGYGMMRDSLVGLAKAQRYPTLLIEGTLDPDLVICVVRSKTDPNHHFLLSERDFKGDQENKKQWIFEKYLKRKGSLLRLEASLAVEFGVARPQLVEDVDAVARYYDLEPSKIQKTSSDLLDDIQTFFQNQFVGMMLVMIGIIGLILEMKMPGLGFPGVVAAICFVLYFWANSSVGDFTLLAILLFALGLILIGVEVFFLPGMAVFGISGVVLVVGSLVLVTLERAPSTSREWFQLGGTLATYTFSLIGAIVVAFLIARYLPQIPYANRLVLSPPTDQPDAADGTSSPASAATSAALLGAIGEAATTLRPAGKARFGDQYLDVVAEGSFVNAGKRVQVIEIEGNRIVVKEV
jgi:membrane-bound ClpP family serine protease